MKPYSALQLHGRITVNEMISRSEVGFQPALPWILTHVHSFVKVMNALTVCGLRSLVAFERSEMVLHIVERPSFSFTALSSKPGPRFGVPTIEEFREMWKAWDVVTLGMVPHHLLHVKPIDLRHKCLFYLGHIPT